jgi:hypothetical protein
MRNRTWPKTFPEGCPPNISETRIITVYRLTGTVISKSDFLQYRVEKPGQCSNITEDCGMRYYMTFGLSVYTRQEELRRIMGASGRMKKLGREKPCIARGDTRDGVHLPTPTSTSTDHRTLWLYDDAEPVDYFKICGRL